MRKTLEYILGGVGAIVLFCLYMLYMFGVIFGIMAFFWVWPWLFTMIH